MNRILPYNKNIRKYRDFIMRRDQHAEELSEWRMGSSIEPIPDNMLSFLEIGLESMKE